MRVFIWHTNVRVCPAKTSNIAFKKGKAKSLSGYNKYIGYLTVRVLEGSQPTVSNVALRQGMWHG